MKKTCNFSAHSNRKGDRFTLSVTCQITYESEDFPTKTDLLQGIKEYFAEDWSRGSFVYYPDQIIVKIGVKL